MIKVGVEARLVCRLSIQDMKLRYASSFLGIIWAFILPLVTIFVLWFVFQLGLRNNPVDDVPYIAWFSSGYISWIFFSDVISSGASSLIEYSYLVKKIKFNIELIPWVKLIAALIVHLFFLAFMFLMCALYGVEITPRILQLIYYGFGVCILSLGFSRLFASITVFFRDMASIVNICIQIGFWVTPILWNEATLQSGAIRTIITINPMHYIVNGYRDAFLGGKWFWERPWETIYFWLAALAIFISGRMVFTRLKQFFPDEV